jgi:hypothetical protein
MCHHRLIIERRPADPDAAWEHLDAVDLGGGLGVPAPDRHLPHARQIALAHAYTDRSRASEIVIAQYSCTGPEGAPVRPFPAGLPSDDDAPAQLAAEVVRLRAALAYYASPGRYQATATAGPDDGAFTVTVGVCADAGERARRALAGQNPEPPELPEPPTVTEQAAELTAAVGQTITDVKTRHGRVLRLHLSDGRKLHIDATSDRGHARPDVALLGTPQRKATS